MVSVNFSGASFIPDKTAPSLPISLLISTAMRLLIDDDVRRYPTWIEG